MTIKTFNITGNLYVNIWLIKHHDDVYVIDTGVKKLVDEQIKAATAIGNPKAIFLPTVTVITFKRLRSG